MTPGQLRERILEEHAELRRTLAELEALSHGALERGRAGCIELRAAGEALLRDLARHMEHEDRYLLPVLRSIDAWGRERAQRVEADHRAQRERMRHYLDALDRADADRADLASLLLELSAWLQRDMAEEEAMTLHPDVLRDDVVAIDVQTG